jgi:PKD repeat protein
VFNSLADTVASSAISITVKDAPVFSGINITPADYSVDSTATLQFSAEAVDQYSDPLANQPTFTWASTGGSIDASGLFTADDNTGTYYIKATATDGVTITDSVQITIVLPGSACTENFDDNYLSSMWTTIIQCEDSQGSVTETAGQLVIDAETSACNNFYSSPRKFFNGIISTPISGDFEVSVKVVSYSSTDAGSRAGIIISPDVSAYGTTDAAGLASVNTRPNDHQFRFYTDLNQDGWFETSDATTAVNTFPKWMKIVRTGDDVSGYYSTDNSNWTLIGTRTIGYGTSAMEVALVAAQSSIVYDDLVFSTCPPTPVIPPTVAISADDSTVFDGTPIQFDGSASLPSSEGSTISSYEWDFGDGNTAGGANVTHTYDTTGTYWVKLTVTDNMGYSDTDSLQIVVDLPVITKEITKNKIITIYPNPAKDVLFIEGVENKPFQIISASGTISLSGFTSPVLDVSALKQGLYILRIDGNNIKIIKE